LKGEMDPLKRYFVTRPDALKSTMCVSKKTLELVPLSVKQLGPLLWLLVLATCGLIIYHSGFNIPYYGDAFAYVYPEPRSRLLYYFVHRNPYHPFYRPVNSSILAFIQMFFGLSTWPVHLVNLSFHTLLAWLVYLFSMRVGLSKSRAMLGSVFMLFSQANANAVLNNDTTSQITGTLFGCLTLWLLYLCYVEEKTTVRQVARYKYYLWALLAFATALWSKETSASFLLMVGVMLLVINWLKSKSYSVTAWASGRDIIPFVAATVGYVLTRHSLGLAGLRFGSDAYGIHFGFNVIDNFARAVFSAVVPVSSVTAFIAFGTHQIVAAALIAIVSLTLLAFVLYRTWRAPEWRLFVLLFSFSILATLPALLMSHVSELYTYNSMPFFSVLTGAALGDLVVAASGGSILRRLAAFAIVASLLVSFVIAINGKASLMFENGARAARLLDEMTPELSKVPANGTLFLVSPSSKLGFSIYLRNGFHVFDRGENIIQQRAGRYDFKIVILDVPINALPVQKDVLILVLDDDHINTLRTFPL